MATWFYKIAFSPRLTLLAPQASASTNSATSAMKLPLKVFQ